MTVDETTAADLPAAEKTTYGPVATDGGVADEAAEGQRGPTAAQLRRFIKSRPYVPLHELRRRFELNGDLDDVTEVELADRGKVYVGLPPRESEFIASLVRDGDIGVELSQDPQTPIIVGVFPMRPVTRT